MSKTLMAMVVFCCFSISQNLLTLEFNTESEKETAESIQDQEKFIDRFFIVAQQEQEKFGIPASITLAQGILESRSGNSQLAVIGNNYFGVKCHVGNGVVCRNFRHKDGSIAMYRIYKSAWRSFRHHSEMLQGARYERCRKAGNDYRAWARALKLCGYAEDPNYPKKLIDLIEKHDLSRFD